MENFLIFIRNPVYNESYYGFNIRNFLSLLFMYFVVMIPLGLVFFFLLKVLNLEHKAIHLNFQEKLLYGILLAPIVEELLFRLILVFNKKNLIVLIFTTFALLVNFTLREEVVKIALFLLLAVNLIIVYKYENQCKVYFIRNFKVLFFLIAGLFAFLHFFNFLGISRSNFLFLPLLVIPQFILGLILGYIRITYGLVYSIFFHVLINCLILF
jgi:hypothetical protein